MTALLALALAAAPAVLPPGCFYSTAKDWYRKRMTCRIDGKTVKRRVPR